MISTTEISLEGKRVKVPALTFDGKTIVVTGKSIKFASVQGEDYSETEVQDPPACVEALRSRRRAGVCADIFTFAQQIPASIPKYGYFMEWDSIAAIRILSFEEWWTNRVSSYLRKDVRKAKKLGVEVRTVAFNDELVRGIMAVYDETPIRQGRRFWHYGKQFENVRSENATYLDRAEFLGAFLGDELIGFSKIVYVNRIARLLQILSKDTHRDKRPMNALIAAAVETAAARGCSHLTYGKYRYSQGDDGITAFKHRCGFEEILVPRYYIPLTLKGRLALRLRLHHGIRDFVPDQALRMLKRLRASIYEYPLRRKTT